MWSRKIMTTSEYSTSIINIRRITSEWHQEWESLTSSETFIRHVHQKRPSRYSSGMFIKNVIVHQTRSPETLIWNVHQEWASGKIKEEWHQKNVIVRQVHQNKTEEWHHRMLLFAKFTKIKQKNDIKRKLLFVKFIKIKRRMASRMLIVRHKIKRRMTSRMLLFVIKYRKFD